MAISTHETRFLLTAKDKTQVALKSAKTNLRTVGQAVTGVHTKLLALAGIGGLGALLPSIISTNAEMQRLKSSLKTVTGSAEAAGEAFEKIQTFAKTTPFDLNQWTEAFIKMKALGLDPSEAALTSYGNTAAAMGKSLNQMIEAVADAATGEFERLKEFGIKAKSEGDNVIFTFQGVSTQVGKNAEEISKYLQSIGNNQFAGAMDDQMQNLDAAFSNLRASVAELAVKLGEAGLNDLVRDLAMSITEMASSVSRENVQAFFDTTKNAIIEAHKVVSGLPYIAEMGLMGYFLFGKKGLAVAAAGSWFINSLGKEIGNAWEEFNPSGVVAGSGGFTGRPGFNPMADYQLGDFARSNGRIGYLDLIKDIEAKREERMANKQDQTNQHLREITDVLRNQPAVAVAG